MIPDEFKYFLKYISKQYVHEVKVVFRIVTDLARPKLWMFIFSVILIFQIAYVKNTLNTMFVLATIIFIWAWDIWKSGHWRGEMRKEKYKELKNKK